MRPVKRFLYCLQNAADGTIPYVDGNNVMQITTAMSGQRIWVKSSPIGWLDNEVTLGRNEKYFGIFRSYTDPLKFFNDSAKIIKEKYFRGKAFEQALTLVILEWNPDTDVYDLYYKGLIDMTTKSELAGQGVEVSVLEDGVPALIKAWESTVFQIPCDGSIPENIKINYDGLLLPDTFFYEFIKTSLTGPYTIIPAVYQGNEGDNFGIIHSDPTALSFKITDSAVVMPTSADYLFSSQSDITVRVKGSMTLNQPATSGTEMSLMLVTSKTTFQPFLLDTEGLTNSAVLFLRQPITTEQIIYFDQEISLKAGENLFMSARVLASSSDAPVSTNPPDITGGSFQLSFNSKAQDTRVWAITAWDLFRLIVKKMNLASTTTDQVFNYAASSGLLQRNLNLCVTSGDALRASGDPNFQKYFNAIQINPNYPSQVVSYTYGPVIKITLADFFKTFSSILCGALGNQKNTDGKEAIFFEPLSYVFNPTVDPSELVSLGEAASFKVSVDTTRIFNRVKAGYKPQTYDQKAGKYEYNTTLELIAPVKSIQKDLDITCIGRADSYGMERLRANIGDTSTTRNGADSDWWIVNTDRDVPTNFIYDYFRASFNLARTNNEVYTDANNNNIKLIPSVPVQGISMPKIDGSLFTINNDPSIFVFNQPGSATRSLVLNITGTVDGNAANPITGEPADTCTIILYKNGIPLGTWIQPVTGPATPIAITFTQSSVFAYQDTLYIRASTSAGATAQINAGSSLSVGGAYFTATNDGSVEILPGASLQLVPLTNIVTTQVVINGVHRDIVSYGFQYFVYNSVQIQNNFGYQVNVNGITNSEIPGGSTSTSTTNIDLFVNGQRQAFGLVEINPGAGPTPFTGQMSNQRDFQLGDIFFVTATPTNTYPQIVEADFTVTSTEVKAWRLKRVQYDRITGVPNIATDPVTGQLRTDIAGAPYNIEQVRTYDIVTAWGSYIRGVLNALVPGYLTFSTLSKNQFLSTTKDNVTKTDTAAREIGSLGMPLFFTDLFEVEINVPATFAAAKDIIVNQHVMFTWNGVPYYGFCKKMSKKATLNEPQKFLLISSPLNDPANLIDLDYDGLNDLAMNANDIFLSRLSPVQAVPMNATFDGRYHYRAIDSDLFEKTLQEYHEKSSSYIPVQQNDLYIPFQFITGGVSPVTINTYNCEDGSLVATINATEITTDAVKAPLKLFEVNVPVNTLNGKYRLTITAGSAGVGATLITETLWVKPDWPDSLLIQFRHSENKLSTVFSTGFTPQIRLHGAVDDFTPYDKSSEYEDEPADIEMIDGIPYDTAKLYLGYSRGVPDWVIRKMNAVMLLDTTFIDGVQFTRNGTGAKWEKTQTPGQPLKYWSLEIRTTKNLEGITVSPSGDTSANTILYNISNAAFGPDSGDNTITQVNEIEP